jgi:protein-S-isoprenylcysteine O-methyltransferase Ste14
METFLHIALPVYFVCYIIFLVGVRSFAVSKKIGKSPVVLAKTDDIHGLINDYFKMIGALMAVYLVVFAVFPQYYHWFLPIEYLNHEAAQIAGIVLLIASFIIVFFAQIHMRNSFRIGIDQGTETELVSGGLFRYSRNPIYVGLFGSVLGLFLVSPNAFTLLIVLLAYVLIQVQVRLEEEYLLKIHGQKFEAYKQKVRRFI